MPQLTPYVTASMLRAALSPPTYFALLDDDQTGDADTVDASEAVLLILKRGHARTISRLPPIYVTLPSAAVPADVPALLQDAELCYCEGIAYNRHAEYVRAYGIPKFAEGDEIMDRIQSSILRIADNPPEPEPRNVGGIVTDDHQRMFLGSQNGIMNSGDF